MVCRECKKDHDEDEPHDPDSPHYQFFFYKETGRYPTWEDAMAHLPFDKQEKVRKILRKFGEDI